MATGTRLMREINDQFLSCKLCEGKFREPKTLTCLHTFCLSCLQAHFDTEAEGRSGRYSIYLRHVTCPVCQRKTELPTGGVRRLPDNFLVSNLTDVLAKRTATKEQPCEICLTVKSKSVEAKAKCLDCSKLLCASCLEIHRSTKVTQHHSLVDLQEEKNIQCKVHEEEHVRYYCSACEACICVLCAFQEHRDHDVCAFSDVTDKHREQLSGMLGQCQGRLQEVTDRLDTLDRHEKAVKATKERIRDMAIAYIAQVRSRERELMQELDGLCGGDVSKLSQEKNSLHEYKADLDSCCKLTDVMLKEQGVDILLVKKDIQSKMTTLLEPVKPDHVVAVDLSELTFVPGDVTLGELNFGGDNVQASENGEPATSSSGVDSDSGSYATPPSSLSSGVTNNSPDVLRGRGGIARENHANTTTMSDVTTTPRVAHTDSQTDRKTLVSRDTSTVSVETRDRGMVATAAQSVKARGTMTERSDVRSLTCQTDTSSTTSSSSQLGSNQSLDQQPTTPVRTEPMPAPDLLPSSPYLYSPGRKIFSRRIQTDISALDTGTEENTLTDAELTKLLARTKRADMQDTAPLDSPSRTRRFDTGSSDLEARRSRRRAAAAVAAAEVETPQRVRGVEAGTMTDQDVRVVPETRDQQTSPEPTSEEGGAERRRRTPKMEEKYTETERLEKSDQETCTVNVYKESRAVLTDQVSTCDRATDSVSTSTQHRAVGTIQVRRENFAVQVNPKVNAATTNTPITMQCDQECQASDFLENSATVVSSSSQPTRETSGNSEEKRGGGSGVQSLAGGASGSLVTRDTASDPIIFPRPCKATETTKIRTSTAATETTGVKKVDRDTATQPTKTVNQWTETVNPQMVSTGITPPRPATLETGVGTTPVLTNDEATGTDVKSYRDSHTEMVLLVCDNETLTDAPLHADAQTSMEVITDTAACGTDSVDNTDEGSMTDFQGNRRHGGRVDDAATGTSSPSSQSPSPQPGQACSKCGHCVPYPGSSTLSTGDGAVDKDHGGLSRQAGGVGNAEGVNSPSASGGDSAIRKTQDVGTMAMSCSSYRPTLQDTGVQTPQPRLLDKGSVTSGDWEEDMTCLRPLAREHQDAATSTESLPYIGLLSEIDVDELIVVPEAAFELVSDSDSDNDVIMVDTQTSTDFVQCVEEGTQTRELATSSVSGMTSSMVTSQDSTFSGLTMNGSTSSSQSRDKRCVGEIIKSMVEVDGGGGVGGGSGVFRDEWEKHLVSIGVNTENALTLEKETCTPMRHLFSKGTMTFYVSKMDKSTSTLGQASTLKPGMLPSIKSRSADKVTMTSQTDRKDVAIETDSTRLDGRITACISKLRNVSERLNSPTRRKTSDGDVFFSSHPAAGQTPKSDLLSPNDVPQRAQPKPPGSPEAGRQLQVRNLLEQADIKLRQKDTPTIRKPQPITTLKGRRPSQPTTKVTSSVDGGKSGEDNQGDNSCDGTQSLPRKLKAEPRSGVVRMGSQPLAPSRLPLLRYNSAPGRIATVPTQTLLNKAAESAGQIAGSRSPRVSPSKIPITKKKSPPDYVVPAHAVRKDSHPDEKPPLRRPLPSITETRTSSSCSDASSSSFASASSATAGAAATSRPSSGTQDVPTTSSPSSSQTSSGVFAPPSPAMMPKPLLGPDLLITVPAARSDGTPSPATSMPPSPRPRSSCTSISHTTSSSSLDKDKSSNTTTPRGSTDTINSTKGGEEKEKSEKPKKSGGLGFMQRLLSKKKKSSDTKKEKPPACKPTLPPAEAAAALSTATLPPPSAPETPQQHWPQLQLPPHHYPPMPEPKSPSPPRKPRPFVIVRQRVVSIQQDNVEHVEEKRRGSTVEIPGARPVKVGGSSVDAPPKAAGATGDQKKAEVVKKREAATSKKDGASGEKEKSKKKEVRVKSKKDDVSDKGKKQK